MVDRLQKATGKPFVDYEESVEEALCFGWIDSKPNKLDEARAMRWFSPRKPNTGWSAINKARIEKLMAAGLMQPAGVAKVKAAQRDGSWNALDEIEQLLIPADLHTALTKYPEAARYFEAFPRSVKRAILEWIALAKKPETRTQRIDETAHLARKNERANQWKKPAAKA